MFSINHVNNSINCILICLVNYIYFVSFIYLFQNENHYYCIFYHNDEYHSFYHNNEYI